MNHHGRSSRQGQPELAEPMSCSLEASLMMGAAGASGREFACHLVDPTTIEIGLSDCIHGLKETLLVAPNGE
jgi:hypothetical protein